MIDFVFFAIGFLLLVTLARWCVLDVLGEKSREWYALMAEARRNQEYQDEPPPAPWEDRVTVKPWYVRLHEWWGR